MDSIFLYFFYEDQSKGIKKSELYKISNEMSLSDIWLVQPEDDERLTIDKLTPVRGKDKISIDILQQGAQDAIRELKKDLKL